jgi:F0F1-type ATP synthase membrane subunit b/b'
MRDDQPARGKLHAIGSLLAVIAILGGGAVWSGCGEGDTDTLRENAETQIEEGTEKAEEAVDDGVKEAEKGIDDAQEEVDKGTEGDTSEKLDNARKEAEKGLDDAQEQAEKYLP